MCGVKAAVVLRGAWLVVLEELGCVSCMVSGVLMFFEPWLGSAGKVNQVRHDQLSVEI